MPNPHTTQGSHHQTLAGQPGDDNRRPPLVSAIVVHYNAPAEILDECLKSLLATHYDALEVILVLNGMFQEKRLQILEKWSDHGRVQVICLKSNMGYGGGVNEGVKHAHGRYIAVLNDDTEFEPSWLEPIIDVMETQTDIGACQPKVRSKGNPAFFDYAGAAGGMLDLFGYPFARGRVFWTVEEDHGQYDNQTDIFWASGAAMVVRRSAWEEVGGFDPIFFLYAEEVDFCWQLHRLGYRVVYVPDSIVHHWGSVSTRRFEVKRTFLISRNHLTLVLKNYSFWQLCFLLPIRLALELVNVVYALYKKQPEWAGSILRGIYSAATSPLSLWRSRRRLMTKARDDGAHSPPFYQRPIVFDYFIRRRLTYAELCNDSGRDLHYRTGRVTSAFAGSYRLQDSPREVRIP